MGKTNGQPVLSELLRRAGVTKKSMHETTSTDGLADTLKLYHRPLRKSPRII